MQGRFFGIPNPKHRVFVYAIYNQNLQSEDSTRKAFHRTHEIVFSFLPCAQKNLSVLTHIPSTPQPSESCNIYDANSKV